MLGPAWGAAACNLCREQRLSPDHHHGFIWPPAQVSFHKYGEFFPGTGALDDVGYGKGKNYTVNVPLKDGMDDDSYKYIYEPVMQKVRSHAGVSRARAVGAGPALPTRLA